MPRASASTLVKKGWSGALSTGLGAPITGMKSPAMDVVHPAAAEEKSGDAAAGCADEVPISNVAPRVARLPLKLKYGPVRPNMDISALALLAQQSVMSAVGK